jgi:hypothetical protein
MTTARSANNFPPFAKPTAGPCHHTDSIPHQHTLRKIHFNTPTYANFQFQGLKLKFFLCFSPFPCMPHTTALHPLYSFILSNIWRNAQIILLLAMQLSPAIWYFTLCPKTFLRTTLFYYLLCNYLQPPDTSPYVQRPSSEPHSRTPTTHVIPRYETKFHTHTRNTHNLVSCNRYFLRNTIFWTECRRGIPDFNLFFKYPRENKFDSLFFHCLNTGGTTTLRHVKNHSPRDTASHPARPHSSATPLSDPHISQLRFVLLVTKY